MENKIKNKIKMSKKNKKSLSLLLSFLTTKANITQQALRFAPILSHEDFLYSLQLKEIFPNLSQTIIISMY